MIMKMFKSTKISEKFAEAVEEKLAGGFKADEAPVGRILAAAEQRVVEGRASKRKIASRFLPRVAVIASVFAIIALALVVMKPASKPTARAVILRALAAMEKPSADVLYIKALNWTAYERPGRMTIDESWLDYKNSRFRRLTWSPQGELFEDELEKDKALYRYWPRLNKVLIAGFVTTSSPQSIRWRERQEAAKSLRKLLRTNRAVMNEETIEGRETYRIEFDPEKAYGGSGRAPDSPLQKIAVNVDKKTFLPIKFEEYSWSRNKWVLLMKREYQVVKWLSSGAVPDEQFTQDLPKTAKKVPDNTLNIKMARAYKGLRLFYLGREFRDLPLRQISPENPGEDEQIKVDYGGFLNTALGEPEESRPSLSLTHVMIGSAFDRDNSISANNPQKYMWVESMTINGREIKMKGYSSPADWRRLAWASFAVGNTRIIMDVADLDEKNRLGAEPRDVLIEAIKNLKPLN